MHRALPGDQQVLPHLWCTSPQDETIHQHQVRTQFLCCWTSNSSIFHSYKDVTIDGEGLQHLTYARHLRPSTRGSFIAESTSWQRTSVFSLSGDGPLQCSRLIRKAAFFHLHSLPKSFNFYLFKFDLRSRCIFVYIYTELPFSSKDSHYCVSAYFKRPYPRGSCWYLFREEFGL